MHREMKQFEDYNLLNTEYYKVLDLKKQCFDMCLNADLPIHRDKVLRAGTLRADIASDVEYVVHHNKDPITAVKYWILVLATINHN